MLSTSNLKTTEDIIQHVCNSYPLVRFVHPDINPMSSTDDGEVRKRRTYLQQRHELVLQVRLLITVGRLTHITKNHGQGIGRGEAS